jgi:membrane protein implicated in regulation of membrane protease activity
MRNYFEGMSVMEQTFWIIALIGTFIFLIILVMSFFGADHDADVHTDLSDSDFDDGGVGFQFFTFKNLVAFLTIFGWTGLVCMNSQCSTGLTVFLSTIAGILMMLATSSLFYFLHKLAETGTMNFKNAIGNAAEVYIPIKADRGNVGKVQIKVQGTLRELEAITDENEDLPTGSFVVVKEIVGNDTLLVMKK